MATSNGYLGAAATNNVAEYHGLLECMTRALRAKDLRVVFQVDSRLVAMQVAPHHPWACRSPSLQELHRHCVDAGLLLTSRGIQWQIIHIYREFNHTADALANAAIDGQVQTSADW